MKSIKIVLAILLVAAVALTFAGCGSGSAGSSEKIRVATADPNVPIDPHKQTSSYVGMISDSIVQPIIKIEADGSLSPLLIKEMPTISEDGLTYTFELKDGVKFHNGETLKTSDVKYSYTRMLQAQVMSTMLDCIEGAQDVMDGKSDDLTGFKIIDDNKFEIKLTKPFAAFESALSTTYTCIYPEGPCKEAGDDWGRTQLVGTGAYKMDSYTAGQGIELSKFDEYHGEAAKNAGVTFRFIEDMNTQVMEYQKGNIDIMLLDSTLYPQYKDNAEIKDDIKTFNPYGLIYLTPNMTKLTDQKVREAISLCIDREAICNELLNGTAKPAKSFIPEGLLGYDETLPEYEYNPEKAKQLLAEAGYPDGITIEMPQSSKYPFKVKIATAIQDQAKAAGINMVIQQYDGSAYNDMANGGQVELGTGNWYVDYVDPDGLIYQVMGRNNTMNESSSFYDNAEFNELINEARVVNDTAKREELYKKADNILTRQDYGAIPICNETKYYLSKPNMKNFAIDNTFRYDFSVVEIAE